MRETEIVRDGRVVRVRDAGDTDGAVVLYFHGTPGSRLDVSFGDQVAAERGIRLVSFDRPGYGRSAPAPFGLASVAADAHAIADELGIARFATLGMSGGGPGALAAAATRAERVIRVGVASGPGPLQEVPGALDSLDDDDRAALALLPGDPAGAAAGFAAGFEPLAEQSRTDGGAGMISAFEEALSARDRELLADPRFAATFTGTVREGLRQGTSGSGWDNVSWIGAWDIDLAEVRCPVLLWYGTDDLMAPVAHGRWLAGTLPQARLVVREGEGHFGIYDHFGEMLDTLNGPE